MSTNNSSSTSIEDHGRKLVRNDGPAISCLVVPCSVYSCRGNFFVLPYIRTTNPAAYSSAARRTPTRTPATNESPPQERKGAVLPKKKGVTEEGADSRHRAMCSTEFLRGASRLFLLLSVDVLTAFNMDVDNPVFRRGPPNSFGFSIAQHFQNGKPICNGQIIIGEQQHNSANNAMTTPTRPNNAKKLNLDEESRIFPDVPMVFASKKEVLTALVQLFSSDQQKSLWEHEEVTQLCWKPDSVKKLECLVHLLVAYLHSSITDLVLKWTHFAIDFAISSNNRHLAGRSFQTASALGLNPTPFLHRILSRLTEVVGDNSEESQSYITDLFMCLQSLAQNMANASHPTNASQIQSPSILSGHSRSVSYTQQISTQQFISPPQKVSQKKSSDMRHSLLIGTELLSPTQSDARPLIRSQSATTLKLSEDNANVLLTEKESETISQLYQLAKRQRPKKTTGRTDRTETEAVAAPATSIFDSGRIRRKQVEESSGAKVRIADINCKDGSALCVPLH